MKPGKTHSIHIPYFNGHLIFYENKQLTQLFWDMVSIIPVESLPLRDHGYMIKLKQLIKKKMNGTLEKIDDIDKELDFLVKEINRKKAFVKIKAAKL
jgi:hypothetical protein